MDRLRAVGEWISRRKYLSTFLAAVLIAFIVAIRFFVHVSAGRLSDPIRRGTIVDAVYGIGTVTVNKRHSFNPLVGDTVGRSFAVEGGGRARRAPGRARARQGVRRLFVYCRRRRPPRRRGLDGVRFAARSEAGGACLDKRTHPASTSERPPGDEHLDGLPRRRWRTSTASTRTSTSTSRGPTIVRVRRRRRPPRRRGLDGVRFAARSEAGGACLDEEDAPGEHLRAGHRVTSTSTACLDEGGGRARRAPGRARARRGVRRLFVYADVADPLDEEAWTGSGSQRARKRAGPASTKRSTRRAPPSRPPGDEHLDGLPRRRWRTSTAAPGRARHVEGSDDCPCTPTSPTPSTKRPGRAQVCSALGSGRGLPRRRGRTRRAPPSMPPSDEHLRRRSASLSAAVVRRCCRDGVEPLRGPTVRSLRSFVARAKQAQTRQDLGLS